MDIGRPRNTRLNCPMRVVFSLLVPQRVAQRVELEPNIEKPETIQTLPDISLVVLDQLTLIKTNPTFCHVLSLNSFHRAVLEPISFTWIFCQPPPTPNDEGYPALWNSPSQTILHSIKGNLDLGKSPNHGRLDCMESFNLPLVFRVPLILPISPKFHILGSIT